MIGTTVHDLDVNVGPGMVRETVEEVLQQLRLQIADENDRDRLVINQSRPAAQIDRSNSQRLVHRLQEISGTIDSTTIAQRLREQIAQYNPGVFHRMMLVDIEVATSFEFEIKSAVFCEQFEHVVEEANSGRDFVSPRAIQPQMTSDLRLFRISLDFCLSHGKF